MSALMIFDLAPIGAVISWSDGNPRPSEDRIHTLAGWKRDTAVGRLVRKRSRTVMAQSRIPASFKVATDGIDDLGAIIGADFRMFSVGSVLTFAVLERPQVGSIRILDGDAEDAELLHLAADQAHAEIWVRSCGFSNTMLREVTADEVAADRIEGRVA